MQPGSGAYFVHDDGQVQSSCDIAKRSAMVCQGGPAQRILLVDPHQLFLLLFAARNVTCLASSLGGCPQIFLAHCLVPLKIILRSEADRRSAATTYPHSSKLSPILHTMDSGREDPCWNQKIAAAVSAPARRTLVAASANRPDWPGRTRSRSFSGESR